MTPDPDADLFPPRRAPKKPQRFGRARVHKAAVTGAAVSGARRQKARRGRTWWLWGLAGVAASIGLGAMIGQVRDDYAQMQAQADAKSAQLASLEAQRDLGRRRLSVLESRDGRGQLLREHGYIQPGERILLFRSTPEEQREARLPRNDVTALVAPQVSPSLWARAGQIVGGWRDSLRGASSGASSAPADSAAPAADAAPDVTQPTRGFVVRVPDES